MGIFFTLTCRLAYNPINLSYDNNNEGQKLKLMDEETEIRRLIRAKNMDVRGHGRFNILNGQSRKGIDEVIP